MICRVCEIAETATYVLEEKPLYLYRVCFDSQCRRILHQFLTHFFWYGDPDSERWAQVFPSLRVALKVAPAAKRIDLTGRVEEIEEIMRAAMLPPCQPLPAGVTVAGLLRRWRTHNIRAADLSDILAYLP